MSIYIKGSITNMQGPCASGYHVPSKDENVALVDTLTSLGIDTSNGNCMKTYLKMPFAGYRIFNSSDVVGNGIMDAYWSSIFEDNTNSAYAISGNAYGLNAQGHGTRGNGFTIRPFNDIPVIPNSSWTTLYSGTGDAGVFHNSTDGLISLSSDGTNWITIADKNLGATVVYNDGDMLSEANCGKYYQRGNNYGFPFTGAVTTSSTQVDASNYGPGNYYSSSTFITATSRDSNNNANLRGGVTGGVTELKKCYIGSTAVKAIYKGTTKIRPAGWTPGANTTLYLPLNGSTKDEVSGTTYSSSNVTYTTWSGDIKCASFNGSGKINLTTTPDFEQGTGELTILAWFTLNSVDGDRRVICLHRQNTYFLMLGMNYSTPRFYVRNSQNDAWTNGSSTLSTGTKYLFTLTAKEDGNATMYINGVQSATKTIGTFIASSFDFGQYIGLAYDGASCYWNGTLKDVIIEDKVRTAQEISDYYNQTK